MDIVIKGERTDPRDWREAQGVPKEKLRPLSGEQKAVVNKLKLSEEGYARTIFASERTQERLIARAKRFGSLLQRKLEATYPGAVIGWVCLVTIELMYQVEVTLRNQSFQIRFDESTVNDLIEGGSKEADHRIDDALGRTLADRVA